MNEEPAGGLRFSGVRHQRLERPAGVAPRSVVGLLIAIRSLSLRGAPAEVIRLARRLLLASSVVTLALNVAEPLIAGEVGKALFDAVGPLLLIGWSAGRKWNRSCCRPWLPYQSSGLQLARPMLQTRTAFRLSTRGVSVNAESLERARCEDRRRRELYQRPVYAENLRKHWG
jgi:hypothetical protein